MGNDTDQFYIAKENYNELVKIVKNIYDHIPEKTKKELYKVETKKVVKKKTNEDYFPKMLTDFNYLLQYSMFDITTKDIKGDADDLLAASQAASINNNNNKIEMVSYLETLFIADIGDLNNSRLDRLVKEAREKKGEKAAKMTFLCCSDNTASEILLMKSALYEFVEPIRIKMTKIFAVLTLTNDKEVVNEILTSLIDCFDKLYGAFGYVDNRVKKEDPQIITDRYMSYFFKDVNEYRNKVKSLIK